MLRKCILGLYVSACGVPCDYGLKQRPHLDGDFILVNKCCFPLFLTSCLSSRTRGMRKPQRSTTLRSLALLYRLPTWTTLNGWEPAAAPQGVPSSLCFSQDFLLLCRLWGRKVRVTEQNQEKGRWPEERRRQQQSVSGFCLPKLPHAQLLKRPHPDPPALHLLLSMSVSGDLVYKSFIL